MNTTTETNAKISAIKFDGYKIELSENTKGPVARYFKFITVGKNKGTYKQLDAYYYSNEQRREEAIRSFINRMKTRESEKNQKDELKKSIRANMKHGFKVGQIYFDSWGYDQTNIDFYEITEVKDKSVMIQAIGSRMVEGGKESGMSSNVAPDPSFKDGEPELKHIQFYLQNDGSPKYYIKSRHGSISLYTYGEKGVYSSWYA